MSPLVEAHFDAFQSMLSRKRVAMTVDEFRSKYHLDPEFQDDLHSALDFAYTEGYGRGREDTLKTVRDAAKRSESNAPRPTDVPWKRPSRPLVTISESSL